jgi:uncharacterized protein
MRFLFAHGAGAPMDSPFMERMVELLARRNIASDRFEFPYMAARRTTGVKRPAPKAETLVEHFRGEITRARAASDAPLLIGGKSMGGRVASMIAQEAYNAGAVVGLVCLGYPFHPPNQPQTWRTTHLATLSCPTLIIQGERDPFGSRSEIETLPVGQTFPPAVSITWIGDGDHDFGPRGGQGYTRKDNMIAAADAVAAFATSL